MVSRSCLEHTLSNGTRLYGLEWHRSRMRMCLARWSTRPYVFWHTWHMCPPDFSTSMTVFSKLDDHTGWERSGQTYRRVVRQFSAKWSPHSGSRLLPLSHLPSPGNQTVHCAGRQQSWGAHGCSQKDRYGNEENCRRAATSQHYSEIIYTPWAHCNDVNLRSLICQSYGERMLARNCTRRHASVVSSTTAGLRGIPAP